MNPKPSPLEKLIPPEIRGEGLAQAIYRFGQDESIKTMLEIGSSDGCGSTLYFLRAILENPARNPLPTLYCLELSETRFAALQANCARFPFIKCYNLSSSGLAGLATDEQVTKFYETTKTAVNGFPLPEVLGWLKVDREYLENGFEDSGIEFIKATKGIDCFDMVLIDGSEFTGEADLAATYGAKWILMDDTNGMKNWANYHSLKADSAYELVEENWGRASRNGYAVFRRVNR